MKHITALRRILLSGTEKEQESKARKMGTTPAYIVKLAGGWCYPSVDFLVVLLKHYPRLRLDHIVAARQERQSITEGKLRGS